MKFVELKVIAGENGKTASYWVNPGQVKGVVKAGVQGEITGPDGNPTVTEKGAVDLGNKIIATTLSVQDLLKKLEGVE